MTESDKMQAVLSLRAIAARANKLANDVEQNRLWPGELAEGIAQINRDLQDINTGR